MTLASFRRHHPDWEMVLVTTNETCAAPTWPDNGFGDAEAHKGYNYQGHDYMENVGDYIDRVWEFDFTNMFKNHSDVHDVHRADMVRWHLMYEYGGVWSDMDVIYIDSLENIDLPEDLDITTSIFPFYGNHTIGHLFAAPRTSFYEFVEKQSHPMYQNNSYQNAGSHILNHHFVPPSKIQKNHPDLVYVNLPYSTFYPFSPMWVPNIYTYESARRLKLDSDSEPDGVTDDTVSIHLFGGHPITKQYLNLTLDSLQKDTIFNYYARAYGDLLK